MYSFACLGGISRNAQRPQLTREGGQLETVAAFGSRVTHKHDGYNAYGDGDANGSCGDGEYTHIWC